MCVYSTIVDHYKETWPKNPWKPFDPEKPFHEPEIFKEYLKTLEGKKELELLKERVADLEELLRKAKIYDQVNEQAECELESKKEELQELADEWGIEIDFP